jgi:hypothetical protein
MLACITTDRIAETDSRHGALDSAISEGGHIYFGKRSVRWPGEAAVLVTLLAMGRGALRSVPIVLGERRVDRIQSSLQEGEDLGRPLRLRANDSIGFAGSYPYGEGFVLDSDEAKKLISRDASCAEVVRPYLIGDDVNNSPQVAPGRYIIDFRDWPREKAERFPECFAILVERVKPIRDPIVAAGKQVHEVDFWKFWDKRLDRYESLRGLRRVIVIARTGKPAAFTFAAPGIVYSDSVVVIASESAAMFAVLQSAVHYTWTLRHCTTRGSTIVYAPSAILSGFPFRSACAIDAGLSEIGERLAKRRQEFADRWGVGLTAIYNLLSSPKLDDEINALRIARPPKGAAAERATDIADGITTGIIELRRLHVELDNAVLAAYGWHEAGPMGPAINLAHDFYEVETLPENDRTRYTISPAARKELLARLLKENHARAAAEAAAAPPASTKPATKSRVKKKPDTNDEGLFE